MVSSGTISALFVEPPECVCSSRRNACNAILAHTLLCTNTIDLSGQTDSKRAIQLHFLPGWLLPPLSAVLRVAQRQAQPLANFSTHTTSLTSN
jgi:hypothetical protein